MLLTSCLYIGAVLFSLALPARSDNKYFHEPGEDDLHRHYDVRFYKDLVSGEEQQQTLGLMIRAYLHTFQELGLATWLAHGTLLGWFWNGKILPWDWDLDAQVSEQTLRTLANYHNVTQYTYHDERLNITRKYLFDINPWTWQRVKGDGDNIIDARFIDMSNGLFLDVTGLSETNETRQDCLIDKNGHEYEVDEIFPLRLTTFEGVSARVPFEYSQILIEEYSSDALINTTFHDHHFDLLTKVWLPGPDPDEDVGIEIEIEEQPPEGGAYS